MRLAQAALVPPSNRRILGVTISHQGAVRGQHRIAPDLQKHHKISLLLFPAQVETQSTSTNARTIAGWRCAARAAGMKTVGNTINGGPMRSQAKAAVCLRSPYQMKP